MYMLKKILPMQELSVPRTVKSACSSGKQTECWQGCIVSVAHPQTSFLQPDWCIAGCSHLPSPSSSGRAKFPHWYWCTVRQTFPGVSHIPPDRAAPCQHAHAWKGCKASTRKKLGLCQLILDQLSYSCSKILEWRRSVATSWIDWARTCILMQDLLADSSYCVLKESIAIPFVGT